MKERVKFALEWERRWNESQGGSVNVSELCRLFGISRETGHYWLRRYCDAGHDVRALEERSRRPRTSPTAVPEEVQDLVVAVRKAHPRWGPRKLRAWLVGRYPERPFPSASAMSAILKRRGLSKPRRRQKRGPAPTVTAPFADCEAPNAVWCVDFKGWFRTLNGTRCYPLTITDAHSRFLLRCEVVDEPDGRAVQHVFDSAFTEFGLPLALRSDNGPPFASTGAGGLTDVAVWWLRLGIRLERIVPGKPQQNGRHERMHLTLKQEVAPAASLRAQQRAFDLWRREFNEERPHEALGLRPPASVYLPSSRRYPRPLLRAEPAAWDRACEVDKDGCIRWNRRKVHISSALSRQLVGLEPADDHRWEVHWGPIFLGHLDERRLDRGLVIPRRRRAEKKVSTMSLG